MLVALLDANAIKEVMQSQPRIQARVAALQTQIGVSCIVLGEIQFGLERLPKGKRRADLESRAHGVLQGLSILPVTQAIALCYGNLKAEMEKLGITMSDNDLWIAATAWMPPPSSSRAMQFSSACQA